MGVDAGVGHPMMRRREGRLLVMVLHPHPHPHPHPELDPWGSPGWTGTGTWMRGCSAGVAHRGAVDVVHDEEERRRVPRAAEELVYGTCSTAPRMSRTRSAGRYPLMTTTSLRGAHFARANVLMTPRVEPFAVETEIEALGELERVLREPLGMLRIQSLDFLRVPARD